jgi:hypothetical protein
MKQFRALTTSFRKTKRPCEKERLVTAGALGKLLDQRKNFRGLSLVLHAGSPKTGSTSLQSYLDGNRNRWLRSGILYPIYGTKDQAVPKHQWVNRFLYADPDEQKFADCLAQCLDECEMSTHTILLSTEGLFNHWWDYSLQTKGWLRELGDYFNVKCMLWLRDPVDFFRSYYIQNLRNPNVHPDGRYGQDKSPLESLSISWVSSHLRYAELLADMKDVFGDQAIFPFAYTPNLIQDVCQLFDIAHGGALTDNENVTTLGAHGISLLRIVNRANLDSADKATCYQKIVEISQLIGNQGGAFYLEQNVVDKIREICPHTKSSLEQLDAQSKQRWFQANRH